MPSLAASRESLEAFDQALLNACALLRPPEKLSIAEWADKYGFLSPEGSSKPGKWYTSNAEYQREPMEVLSPGSGFETVVLMWSSQVGKTQIALWFAAFYMEHDPGPILFMEPDEGLAKMVALERINPMIRDCPRLTPLFGKRGAKGAGNDTFAKRYPGGQLNLVWASSPLSLAGRPLPYVVSDEQSAYLAGATKEGSPSKIVKARMATYPRVRRHLKISSPRLKRTCETTADFELSDQRHYYVPCPDCGHEQILTFDRLRYERASLEEGNYAIADCWYECDACEYHITEVDKYSMIRQGKWRAHKPGAGDGKTAGFHLSALYSPLGYTWAELAGEYLACEGLNERLQPFYNTKLGLPWDEQAEGADKTEIAKRAEDYEAQAPEGVIIVTCGADVQKDRIEATKWGWGLQEQSWMIEHRIFHGDPLQPEVWKEFEAWRSERVESELGIPLPTACTFVDSGDGNRQQAVLQYTKAHQFLGVRACKGASQSGAPLVSEARPVGRIRALQVLVGGSAAKDTLYGRFQIYDKSRPGAVHFPRHESSGASAQYFKHLTAEVLVTHQSRDGEYSQWENPHKRNEALDCAVYAYAAKEFTRANLKDLHRKLLAKVDRMRELGRLLQVSAPQRVAMVAAALQSSPSLASSPASPSPKPHHPRPKRRRIRLPGAAWVSG